LTRTRQSAARPEMVVRFGVVAAGTLILKNRLGAVEKTYLR
jgi:hypothetical protein